MAYASLDIIESGDCDDCYRSEVLVRINGPKYMSVCVPHAWPLLIVKVHEVLKHDGE